jgi:hypothetical protein
LDVRRLNATDAEEMNVILVADNRRLRQSLQHVFGLVRARLGKRDLALDEIKNALNATKELGVGRLILAIELQPDQSRAGIEEKIARVLDAHFVPPPAVQEGTADARHD